MRPRQFVVLLLAPGCYIGNASGPVAPGPVACVPTTVDWNLSVRWSAPPTTSLRS